MAAKQLLLLLLAAATVHQSSSITVSPSDLQQLARWMDASFGNSTHAQPASRLPFS
jgi:hypothetical protein